MSKKVLSIYVLLIEVILICACSSAKITSPIYVPASTYTANPIDTLTSLLSSKFSLTSSAISIRTVTPLPAKTDTATPLPTSTPTITNTPIPILPIITDWYTYTHSSGVSIQYPSGWDTSVYSYTDSVDIYFRLAKALDISPFYQIFLEVYERPINYRKIADPHTWQPNEGGYEIHWEKQLNVDNTPGIIFVWGAYRIGSEDQQGEWDTFPDLIGILYSEKYELDIRLSAYFNAETARLFDAERFEDVFKARYYVFDHMFRSIRINEPTSGWPISNP